METTKKEMIDFLNVKIERTSDIDLDYTFRAGLIAAYNSIIFNIENDMIKDYTELSNKMPQGTKHIKF